MFADLVAATPVLTSDDRTFTLGIAARVAATSLWTGTGGHTGLRHFGGDVWLVFDDDEDDSQTLHSLVASWHQPIEAIGTEWILFNPNEIAYRLSGAYDGFYDLGRFDVSLSGRAGFTTSTFVDLHGSLAVLAEITDELAVGVGGTAGLLPYGLALATARYRPAPHVEIGAGVSVPVVVFAERAPPGTPLSAQPTLEVKIYR